MACGRPVIGHPSAPLPEYIVNEESGSLVPPGDRARLARAMIRLSDPGLAHKMGRAGAERASKLLNWELAAARVLALYEEASTRRGYLPSAQGAWA